VASFEATRIAQLLDAEAKEKSSSVEACQRSQRQSDPRKTKGPSLPSIRLLWTVRESPHRPPGSKAFLSTRSFDFWFFCFGSRGCCSFSWYFSCCAAHFLHRVQFQRSGSPVGVGALYMSPAQLLQLLEFPFPLLLHLLQLMCLYGKAVLTTVLQDT